MGTCNISTIRNNTPNPENIISIIDTGIDTSLFDSSHLWVTDQDAFLQSRNIRQEIYGGISLIPEGETFPYFADSYLEFYEAPTEVRSTEYHGTRIASVINHYTKENNRNNQNIDYTFMVIRAFD
ncbi:MAG: hypothetical protein V3V00_07715 [Saprospiraceae bacterium]